MADSEVMAHYLSLADYKVIGLEHEADLMDEADLIIFNTCTVKNPSDDKFFSQLNKQDKPLVITGCIPQSVSANLRNSDQGSDFWLNNYSALGVEQLDAIVEVVDQTLQGNIVHRLGKGKRLKDRTFLPALRKNKYISIIPLLQGCLGHCTYCKTKFARGHLKSYPQESIIEQVRSAKAQGIKEVWLVSEDNGAYGLDIGTDFPTLLQELTKIEGSLKIRVGMFNPEYAYKYRNELAEIFKHPLFYRFLHIPLQAGNNQVLADMVRPYTVQEWKEAIRTIREAIPDMRFATDIICGFPTENGIAFQDTMNLLREVPIDMINISKFYARPETKAASMKQLSSKVIKTRSRILTRWFEEQNRNKDSVGS
ncbi:MAG: tRNA (N(6)-L-threonylcarbamoyladenosine(37)-C(2))-methylthiotransferase, partial [Nanoarchaeota archaeon]|nr:tRNA (N(6)-L-threonylcarbamoyladenosine(37)-C(2))-methylthiotransferase [Nanoarchaeota archaeon]